MAIGTLRNTDWDTVGYNTMAEVRDEALATSILGHKLVALAEEVRPESAKHEVAAREKRIRGGALHSQLYDRPKPVRDTVMLALSATCVLLGALFIVAFLASGIGHAMTLQLFGWSMVSCMILGFALTGLVTAIGYLTHTHILSKFPLIEGAVILITFMIMLSALADIARARGAMSTIATNSTATSDSFVDGKPAGRTPVAVNSTAENKTSEAAVSELFSQAVVKLAIATDLAVGLLLGALVSIWTSSDFAGWRRLRTLNTEIAKHDGIVNTLAAIVAAARHQASAGILRGRHFARPKHPSYLQIMPLLFVAVLGLAEPSFAQSVTRQEAILLDVSRSIVHGGKNRSLFDEMLAGVSSLLKNEPAESRVWVFVISTDSFGAVEPVVGGYTPPMHGVFADKLNLARQQLVDAFKRRTTNITPNSNATDIIGGLWRTKAAFDAASASAKLPKDIYIFTDGINHTGAFNMPALIPTGADNMLIFARNNNMLVPLAGYRVHVYGASTLGLSPFAWNTIKSFWTAYFRAAGAELVIYSSEANIERS